jgi:hypothetical protein
VGDDPQVAYLVLVVDEFEGLRCGLELRHDLFRLSKNLLWPYSYNVLDVVGGLSLIVQYISSRGGMS